MPQNFRIYSGENETTTVIGATDGVRLTLWGSTFDRILDAVSDDHRQYEVVPDSRNARPPQMISPHYVEIAPPLASEAVEPLGKLLAQEAFRDRGDVTVVDNRDGLPANTQDAHIIRDKDIVAIAA
jgi:hypothetical protein